MKTIRLICICGIILLCTSCLTTLMTVATTPSAPRTTVVVEPAPQVIYQKPVSTTTTVKTNAGHTSTTVQVNAISQDVSLYLDLQAVAAAFAQSSSVEEFEMILNSSRYMISNLDLNHDGFVDYLRVIEVVHSYNHVFVLQAVLGYNIFQNVATLTLELGPTPYFQIIGDPFVYGANYIVQPVFVKTPPLYSVLVRPAYMPWSSPYYWNYWPAYYAKPQPQYLSHYQAYVNTFITNHKYCHQVTYPTVIHYTNYITIINNVSRHDYRDSHPNEAFDKRTSGMTYTPQGATRTQSLRNAADVRQAVSASTTTSTSRTTTSTNTSARNTTTSTSKNTTQSTTQRQATTTTKTTTTTRTTQPTTTTSPQRTTTTTKTTTTTSTPRTSTSLTTSSRTATTTRSTTPVNTSSSRTAATTTTTTTTQPSSSRTISTTSKINNTGQVRSTSTSTTTTRSATTTSSSSNRSVR